MGFIQDMTDITSGPALGGSLCEPSLQGAESQGDGYWIQTGWTWMDWGLGSEPPSHK